MRANFLKPITRTNCRCFSTETDHGKKLRYNKEMFKNPYIERHQLKRESVSDDFHKHTTGLTGLYVNERPHEGQFS